MADDSTLGMARRIRPDDLRSFFDSAGLTPRESASLLSVLRGQTAAELAAEMGVSSSTVGGYRLRAYKKLGVTNRGEFQHLVRDRFGEGCSARPSLSEEGISKLVAIGLSRTEAAVIHLACSGYPTKEIATVLAIAPGTVSSAKSRGYRLLGIRSAKDLPDALRRLAASGLLAENTNPRMTKTGDSCCACVEARHGKNEEPRSASRPPRRILHAKIAVLTVLFAVSTALLVMGLTGRPADYGPDKVDIPERFVDTEIGRVPDVSGMDLHHAASVLASHRLYPVLENSLENDSTLKVDSLIDFREIDDSLPESTVIESPQYGWVAFNRGGDWAGAVVLALSR